MRPSSVSAVLEELSSAEGSAWEDSASAVLEELSFAGGSAWEDSASAVLEELSCAGAPPERIPLPHPPHSLRSRSQPPALRRASAAR